MARIRTIKPTIWQSEQLGRVSIAARLLFVGLISQADDDGRQRGAAALVKALVFPYDDISTAEVDALLDDLARVGLIVRYQHDDASYLAIPSFGEHQAINRKTASTLPPPPDHAPLSEPSVSPHVVLSEASRQEGKGREGTATRASAREAAPPGSVADIVAPLGRTLTPHQRARADRVHAEHGPDVLAYLVEKARGPGVDRPIAAFVGFLRPESDALVEAVEATTERRAAAQLRAADVERVLRLKRANGIPVEVG